MISEKGLEGVREFLESSSIHGLSYIASTRGLVRILWTCVVITGFTCAGLLINQAFSSWATSPVSTTIETLPISDLDFPNVTVCPPRNSFTSLNPDLVRARNVTFEAERRKELSDFLADFVFDTNYNRRYSAFAAYEDKENWYTGETQISLPFTGPDNILHQEFRFQNITGTFSTAFFRQPFNESSFESLISISICLEFPRHFEVDKGGIYLLHIK